MNYYELLLITFTIVQQNAIHETKKWASQKGRATARQDASFLVEQSMKVKLERQVFIRPLAKIFCDIIMGYL